jgi:Mu transposase-like protein
MGMPRRVTAVQVKELRRYLNQGASLRTAAMRANMDRKSARKYRNLGQLPEEVRRPHTWRTRPDPLVEVWPAVVEQLHKAPGLQAKTLWEWLQREQPGKCPESVRRTLERRVRQWKALHGSAPEVFFAQKHTPGRLAASDFTSMNDLQITIGGAAFPHLLYHFVLTYSNWEDVTLCFGEDFASLSTGWQNALWALGAVPERHRTDRMTLAVHHDGQAEQFTDKYRALMAHYGVQAEATNPASGNENGDVESSHRHFKEAVDQALLLRGSRDFGSRDEYWQLVQGVQGQRNACRTSKLAEELMHLHALPARRLESLERVRVRVRRGSTIGVKHNTYSVPARLCGEEVEARIGLEEIEVWYAGQCVQRMPRLRGQDKHHIDYRHIIDWLVRKPGAFARYVYREDLYPTQTYRRAYDALVSQQAGRADKEYVHLLHLAAQEGEVRVAAALAQLLEGGLAVSEQAVRTLLGESTPLAEAAQVEVAAVDLGAYDALLEGSYEENSDSGLSLNEREMEENHEQGCDESVDGLSAGATPAGGAQSLRGGGPASQCRDVELSGIPGRAAGAGVPAAPAEPHRPTAEGIAPAPGEKLGGAGSETSADEGGAAVARPAQWGLCGSAGEHSGIRPARLGEDACAVCAGPGAGALRAAVPVHDDGAAGAGTIDGQTGLDAEGAVEAPEPLGGADPRRSGLRAAEPGGDGGTVHAAGGALRARQCVPDEQSAVLEVGAGVQGSDDDGSGHRSAGASQCDRGAERTELSSGSGQTSEDGARLMVLGRPGTEPPRRGPGYAPVALAALGLPALRQAPAAVWEAGLGWGMIIVAHAPKVPTWGPLRAPGWGIIIVAQGER